MGKFGTHETLQLANARRANKLSNAVFCAAHMQAKATSARAKPAAAMAPKGDADIPK